jgi:putative tryptophan/tyrosine transport system substrate-binding protein
MRRREFITLLGGVASSWPLAARAQQAAMPLIGFLNGQSPDVFAPYAEGFRNGLKDAGFVAGQNVEIEYRWARGRYETLPALASELVARQPAVLVATGGDPVVVAAKAATAIIPIAFLVGGNPIQSGFAASFNRPGGTLTGVTMLTTTLDEKRLGLLREVVPQSTNIALLSNPNFPGAEGRGLRAMDAAHALGATVVILTATTEAELDSVVSGIDRSRVGALLVSSDPFFNNNRDMIVALAANKAIPAIYEWREFAFAGGLMSYGARLPDMYRQVGVYAGRMLKGEKPADMPIQQPTKFEFVINLKTAKTLGLTFPPGLLAIADEVIE